MRLIDVDALRSALQKVIDEANPPYDNEIGAIRCGVRLARNIAEDEPVIDAVPVVRCKDCKDCRKRIDVNMEFCDRTGCGTVANGFCSWGERRKDETD